MYDMTPLPWPDPGLTDKHVPLHITDSGYQHHRQDRTSIALVGGIVKLIVLVSSH